MKLARTLTLPVAESRHRLEARFVDTRGVPHESLQLAVIAPPHPMYGGTIGNPVVKAMERALQAAGLSTLAFNFRGTGDQAEGEPSGDYEDALHDYLAAARALPDARLCWLGGYSFGSVAALASAIELGAERVLMVAPPLGMLDPALLTRYAGQLAVLVGTEDEYAPVDAVRAAFSSRPNTVLELLPDAEHFFLGSDLQRLSDGLTRLLLDAGPGKSPHVP